MTLSQPPSPQFPLAHADPPPPVDPLSPLDLRISALEAHAAFHSQIYKSPEFYLQRDRYIAQHPTRIIVLSCMDGRVNLPLATRTPDGIIRTFRNLGGRFDLGWPNLCDTISAAVFKAVKTGRRVLAIVTYHFSKGDEHRGCAGFHYDTEAAKAHVTRLQGQFATLFGGGHATVYPLLAGFETDEESLIIHGTHGDLLNISELSPHDSSKTALRGRLDTLLPDMPEEMRKDLLPLLTGNVKHVAETKLARRVLEIEHREWVLCVGRGFDWMTLPNTALIVGPYSPSLSRPILTAASIILSNMKAGRIPSDGFLLLSSFPFEDPGVDRSKAEMKARFMARFAAKVIKEGLPELADKMRVKIVCLDWRTREQFELEEEEHEHQAHD